MLEIRPNCELCDKDLPHDALDAMICSYECTFCVSCVMQVLTNVCPTCGGGFAPRPIRPKTAYRKKLSIEYQPPSQKRVINDVNFTELESFFESLNQVAPENR
jgi:hypothetical protein